MAFAASRLPPEVIGEIVSYLAQSNKIKREQPLGPYAVISRQWQPQVERYTFKTVILTQERLVQSQSRRILSSTRMALIRHLIFQVQLPSYPPEARRRAEDDDDKGRNNAAFTAAVQDLFRFLHPFNREKDGAVGIDLTLKATCPSDTLCGRGSKSTGGYFHLGDARWNRSYLEYLDNWDELPSLECVHRFSTVSQSRNFMPIDICRIVSRFPRLGQVHLTLFDSEKRDVEKRTRLRSDFVKGISLLPSSIKRFDLDYVYRPPRNERSQPPNIIPPDCSEDPLGAALRSLGRKLEWAGFSGCFDTNAFWKPSSDPSEIEPWPHLRTVYFDVSRVAPSGKWRFVESDSEAGSEASGDSDKSLDSLSSDESSLPSSDSSFASSGLLPALAVDAPEDLDERICREAADTDSMDDLLLKLGLAAQRMPVIETFEVTCGGWNPTYVVLTFQPRKRSITLRCATRGADYEPSEAVREVWEGAARRHDIRGIKEPWTFKFEWEWFRESRPSARRKCLELC